jgi:hypothetical protein
MGGFRRKWADFAENGRISPKFTTMTSTNHDFSDSSEFHARPHRAVPCWNWH